MRILFCNIAWMDYYKGNVDGKDTPIGGGAYVAQTEDANEKYNFEGVSIRKGHFEEYEGEYCLGFVETKSTNGKTSNQLNIENINGCELYNKEEQVEDVLVIYCAKYPDSDIHETFVVGWYQHATVYRNYQSIDFPGINDDIYTQDFNAIAKKEDCVLLPRGNRRKGNIWRVPRKRGGISYGFGQANVWYASEVDKNENLRNYLERIEKQIKEYDGENWIDTYSK